MYIYVLCAKPTNLRGMCNKETFDVTTFGITIKHQGHIFIYIYDMLFRYTYTSNNKHNPFHVWYVHLSRVHELNLYKEGPPRS